ncbi:MAG: hypothetical protein AAF846_19105 [Chloroflexota bacterium]
MTNPKKFKVVHALPNRQLAKAFNFTSEDLQANRLGFLTREQKWDIPSALRPITRAIGMILPTRQRDKVDHMCGRLELGRDQSFHYGFATFQQTVTVSGGYGVKFIITDEQYAVLAQFSGIYHHIYYIYRGDTMSRIVSIVASDFPC